MLNIGSVGTSSIMNVAQEAISLTEGLTCRVVYSRDGLRGQAYAQSVGVPESCTDYMAMLERKDLEIIYIASPNRLHFVHAMEALSHGKHVIVEKPLVTTKGEAEALFTCARKNDVFLFEAITTLYMPQYRTCRSLLPRIGEIQKAEISYTQYSSQYDAYLRGENPNIFNPSMHGGALNDLGVYCVHVALDLFGIPNKVTYEAEYGANGIDLSGTLMLYYPKFACKIVTAKNANLGRQCRVEGSHGWFAEDGPLNNFVTCTAEVDSVVIPIEGEQKSNRMVYQLEKFRDAILHRDKDFFEQSAQHSIAVCSVLGQAHQCDFEK